MITAPTLKQMGRHLTALLCAIALSGNNAIAADGQTVHGPQRLLYVGNSFYYYNNSLHGHVNRLLSSALPKPERELLQSFSVTISGGHLRWHNVGAYLDAGIGDSAFNDNNEIVASSQSTKFDAVLMMDCSRCPYDETTRSIFHEQVREKGGHQSAECDSASVHDLGLL